MPEALPAPVKAKSAPQKALEKLGLLRDIDLALHLPLRYEDETRLTPIAQARDGDTVQCEGEIVHPTFKLVNEGKPLATALTPVYPTSATLPRAYLRKAVGSALQRAPLTEILPGRTQKRPRRAGLSKRRSGLRNRRWRSPAASRSGR